MRATKVEGRRFGRLFKEERHLELARMITRDLRAARARGAELAPVVDRPEFLPLPEALAERPSWRTLWAARWKDPEPIHRLEGRASIATARWLLREPYTYRRRMLMQDDNLSFTHNVNAGRAGLRFFFESAQKGQSYDDGWEDAGQVAIHRVAPELGGRSFEAITDQGGRQLAQAKRRRITKCGTFRNS